MALCPGTGEVLAFASTAGGTTSTFIPLEDGQGSALGLVNSGNVLQAQFAYDPFGNPSATGTASQYPYLFKGMEYDATGLYYGGGVYYSPNLGRPHQQVTPGGGGQGGINVSTPSSQGSSGGLGPANYGVNAGVTAAAGAAAGFIGGSSISLVEGYIAISFGFSGGFALPVAAVVAAILGILDLFGFDLFGGGGSAPVIPPGYYRHAHYPSSAFIGCSALILNMEDSTRIYSTPSAGQHSTSLCTVMDLGTRTEPLRQSLDFSWSGMAMEGTELLAPEFKK